jgi:dTDP-4-amino-4,6-dideoxygalactose transaminase
MKIPYVNTNLQWSREKRDLLKVIDKTLSTDDWVGGKNIAKFESNIKSICKTKYAVALNSGTDALTLGLYTLNVRKGDEVITTPNSFIASAATIVHLGAKPVFVDVQDDQNINPDLIEKAITKKTKAIMPVHLTGRMSDMKKVLNIAKKYKIPVIEDAAQSIGSLFNNKPAGSYGEIGCFSAHPLKNLNAIGDSGYLTTNNYKIYQKVIELRNHGMVNRNKVKNFGHVSRMDNLQAAVLNFRIKNLKKVISQRRKNFDLYKKFLNSKHVFFPLEKKNEFNTYHTFVIQIDKRNELKKFLLKNNIFTAIHYPIPIHLQPAAKTLGYKKGSFKKAERQAKRILTLPINQFLNNKQIKFISEKINYFFEKKIY